MSKDYHTPRRLTYVWGFVLCALGFFAYSPAIQNGFVPYDDIVYVLENEQVLQGLTKESIAWAFREFYGGNWHPLTWLSHMLDIELFGLNSKGHHAVSVALHIFNALLLFSLLLRMTGRLYSSWAVAVIFAVHPLHVESVAWISERKDVLSAMFWLLATHAYVWYAKTPSYQRYFLVLLCMSLGLLCKAMLVTFPFTLLLLDYWPLQRVRAFLMKGAREDGGSKFKTQSFLKLIFEKLPLLALSLTFSFIALKSQTASSAVNTLYDIDMAARLSNSVVSYWVYIKKMVYPFDLAIMYPFPWGMPFWKPVLAVAGILSVTAIMVVLIKRAPFLTVGWLWFLGTLVPVIGIVHVGKHALADRYAYIPLIGAYVVIVWTLSWFADRNRLVEKVVALFFVVSIALLAIQTQTQVRTWKDGKSLLTHAVETIPNHKIALGALGKIYFQEQDYVKASKYLTRYVELDVGDLDVVKLLLTALNQTEQFSQAAHLALYVLKNNPEDYEVLLAGGRAFYGMEKFAIATQLLSNAHQKRPKDVYTSAALAMAYLENNQSAEGVSLFEDVLNFASAGDIARLAGYAPSIVKHGEAALREQRFELARRCFQLSVTLKPEFAVGRFNLGIAYGGLGDLKNSVLELSSARGLSLKLKEEQGAWMHALRELEKQGAPDTLLETAWSLAVSPEPWRRNGPLAIYLSEKALEKLSHPTMKSLDVLAASLAENGQFALAASVLEQASALFGRQHGTKSLSALQKRMNLYNSQQPFRSPTSGYFSVKDDPPP